jgi:hypothetical protein
MCNRLGEKAPAVVVPVPLICDRLQFVLKISNSLIRGHHVFHDNCIPWVVFFCASLFDGDRVSQSAEVFCKLLSRACLRENDGEVDIARLSQVVTSCRDVTKRIAVFVIWKNGQAAVAPSRRRRFDCTWKENVYLSPGFKKITQFRLSPFSRLLFLLRRFGCSWRGNVPMDLGFLKCMRSNLFE